jgi:hypothetical protein
MTLEVLDFTGIRYNEGSGQNAPLVVGLILCAYFNVFLLPRAANFKKSISICAKTMSVEK